MKEYVQRLNNRKEKILAYASMSYSYFFIIISRKQFTTV